ncbi:Alpha/Beta hydrolase protein [Schizophyllum amplum]|uniref:triacylglycerol lipase n=1 Tax=Schizophyllum amplum TaxID=97359 RepID=A0A550BXA9_9AGAR|nr:Alpha/Beta hydrolase protein [Auriculariopsis ampla]
MLWDILPSALRAMIFSSYLVSPPESQPPASLQFQLRHHHAVATNTSSRIIFADVPESQALHATSQSSITTRPVTIHRPSSFSAFNSARFRFRNPLDLVPLRWDASDIPGPDYTRRDVLLELAKMTYNSYYEPSNKEWYDLGEEWNNTSPFGWEPSAAGFRGHVFVSTDNSTVVISVKGTSVGLWEPSRAQDKLNDNLLFSCCCAKVGPTWSAVCPCAQGGGKCGQQCIEQSLVDESLFYPVGLNLYNNVTYLYPDANIWLIGHSLGGSLAALMGATFGAPVVAFETPADRMAARRLHLPSPPSTLHITHVFHTADPIPMGACTGVTSICAIGGYALESRCHQGQRIVYDTITELGWAQDARTHPIKVIIDQLLSKPWNATTPAPPPPGKKGDAAWWWPRWPGGGKGDGEPDEGEVDLNYVPPAVPEEEDCLDCYAWEYV